MIEFIPGRMDGVEVNVQDASTLAEAYIKEIQHRKQMAEAAGECLKQAIQDCGIDSGEMVLTPSATAAILSPVVGPDKGGTAVIKAPLRLDFYGEENSLRAEVVVRDNLTGRNDYDITIQVFQEVEGDTCVYDFERNGWFPVKSFPPKHELIQVIELETGLTFTKQEGDQILQANQELVKLKEAFPAPGLLRYSTYSIGKKGSLQSEVCVCLIPANPACSGVTVLIDRKEGGRLSLCQRYMNEELEYLYEAATDSPDSARYIPFDVENEWISVGMAEHAEELVPVITGMLDHYTADVPAYIFPLSVRSYAAVSIHKDGEMEIRPSIAEEDMDQREKSFYQMIKDKIGI